MATQNPEEEEMTVDIVLDDDTTVTCEIVTILEVEGKDYIVLLPRDGADEQEVWIYRYSENPDDPNEEPVLEYIDNDEEYEIVADAFDEFMDCQEFDSMGDDE